MTVWECLKGWKGNVYQYQAPNRSGMPLKIQRIAHQLAALKTVSSVELKGCAMAKQQGQADAFDRQVPVHILHRNHSRRLQSSCHAGSDIYRDARALAPPKEIPLKNFETVVEM
ncbi:uncharacterized protein LOC121404701 [Drosophila obscura]|uniref:uncharacterized protein LOC121404701 n=1 Tax=Drosophila obscura TaxID=7282 RepID=UPI001BB1A936|nr:uncharacterized protein LOC121404701 [Drosophila obscura]